MVVVARRARMHMFACVHARAQKSEKTHERQVIHYIYYCLAKLISITHEKTGDA